MARRWCGRLGKVDDCRVGVLLAYVSSRDHAPLDRRLYLPEAWADDPARRQAGHVPEGVAYRKTWEIAAESLARGGPGVPHGWVNGDDELGRASESRALPRRRGERYVLDVPCDTTIRDLDEARPESKPGDRGRRREVPFRRADRWAAGRWTRLTIRDGDKGPLEVEAVVARVQARWGRRVGPQGRLVVIRTVDLKPEVTYSLSNAAVAVPLAEVVGVRSKWHRVERVFQEAKGEVGPAHHEVRSWVAWHRHVTLSLLALWFLILERCRMGGGGKDPALTACQVRSIFTKLLSRRPPTSLEIAEEISDVPRRDEEARSYHWHARTKTYPPRRPTSGFD